MMLPCTNSGEGYVHKLATVDSLAVYCDGPSASSLSSAGRTSSAAWAGVKKAGMAQPGPAGHAKSSAYEVNRSYLAGGVGDDLERMFKASLAVGHKWHDYVVIPTSPSFRLRIQRGGGSGGVGGGVLGGACYKVQAIFNEVRARCWFGCRTGRAMPRVRWQGYPPAADCFPQQEWVRLSPQHCPSSRSCSAAAL